MHLGKPMVFGSQTAERGGVAPLNVRALEVLAPSAVAFSRGAAPLPPDVRRPFVLYLCSGPLCFRCSLGVAPWVLEFPFTATSICGATGWHGNVGPVQGVPWATLR